MVDPGTEAGVEWTKTQQRLLGLEVDGKLGPDTVRAYVKRFGPLRSEPHTMMPMPYVKSMWGYDHTCDDPEGRWPIPDPGFEATLDELHNGFMAAMLRLLTGFNTRTREFNRWPRSVISLDTLSAGAFHYWAQTLADHLPAILADVPGIEQFAFQQDPDPLDDIVVSPHALEVFLKPKTGKMALDFRLADLVVGWRFLMVTGPMVRRHCQGWASNYLAKALQTCRHFGWHVELKGHNGAKILALVTRMENSGAARARIRNSVRTLGKHASPLEVLKHCYYTPRNKGGYGKIARYTKVMTWDGFNGPAPTDFTVA